MRLPILAAVFTLGACACVFAAPAFAHSPYLLPNAFDATGRDHVTVEGSFTERFFTPDVVMKSDSFAVVGPDGAVQALKPAYFRDLTVLETDTKQDGTWRITSGQRVGRTADAAFVKDASGDGWVFFDPEKGPPAGAKAVKMTSLTKAEVYVSRGKPSDKPLAPTGQGLEFHALTHPNSIFAGEPAKFELLYDGRPLANHRIGIAAAGEPENEDGSKGPSVTTDEKGRYAIKADKPVVYVAMTRYRVAPVGAEAGRSFTYTLTFDVAR